MAKTAMKTSATQVAAPSNDEPMMATASDNAPETIAVADHGGKRKNIFQIDRSKVSTEASQKIQLLSQSRQLLAEAQDYFAEGSGKVEEGNAIAAKAGVTLYQAQANGLASKDEVSAVLGDIFGYKVKKDGTPSKTPEGRGEEIRKRVVRLVNARNFVFNVNDAGGAFFDGVDPDAEDEDGNTFEDILNGVETGDVPFWQAYVAIAKIKNANIVRVNRAFDPKHIAALADALAEEGAVDMIRNSPALITAYAALIDILDTVGESAAEAA